MTPIPFIPPPCCSRQSIANMDHETNSDRPFRRIVNRVCTKCWTHWYGQEGVVVRYSKREWDEWMARAFDADIAAAKAA